MELRLTAQRENDDQDLRELRNEMRAKLLRSESKSESLEIQMQQPRNWPVAEDRAKLHPSNDVH